MLSFGKNGVKQAQPKIKRATKNGPKMAHTDTLQEKIDWLHDVLSHGSRNTTGIRLLIADRENARSCLALATKRIWGSGTKEELTCKNMET